MIIDGVIDSPNTRPWAADGELALMDPTAIADAYLALHNQPPTVWSHEIQLTPNHGTLGMRV